MKIDDKVIGEAVRKARRAKDMTQQQLGDSLDVTYQQVQKYEKGESRMATTTFLKACGVLGIEPAKPVIAWIERSNR